MPTNSNEVVHTEFIHAHSHTLEQLLASSWDGSPCAQSKTELSVLLRVFLPRSSARLMILSPCNPPSRQSLPLTNQFHLLLVARAFKSHLPLARRIARASRDSWSLARSRLHSVLLQSSLAHQGAGGSSKCERQRLLERRRRLQLG